MESVENSRGASTGRWRTSRPRLHPSNPARTSAKQADQSRKKSAFPPSDVHSAARESALPLRGVDQCLIAIVARSRGPALSAVWAISQGENLRGRLDVNPRTLGQSTETLRGDGMPTRLAASELSAPSSPTTIARGDRFFRDWVDDHYCPMIKDTLHRLTGVTATVRYEIIERPRTPTPVGAIPAVNSLRTPVRLNERFTFETYVVADSNQLPAAAAMAVADAPGKNYNPLFIYGGTGLGKTHLLHAVGNRILQKEPGIRIVYLSSEEFTNQFIESVRDHRMTEFRKKFREECDVLDRRHPVPGKKQETRTSSHLQLAPPDVEGDRPPATWCRPTSPGSKSGRSRFTMGLITDVQEPNFEMRVAILKKKAASDGFLLPDNVAHHRPARGPQRPRRGGADQDLRGTALGQAINEEFAGQVLRTSSPPRRRSTPSRFRPRCLFLQGAAQTSRASPHQEHRPARQVAMYLLRTRPTPATRRRQQVQQDHSTVILGAEDRDPAGSRRAFAAPAQRADRAPGVA